MTATRIVCSGASWGCTVCTTVGMRRCGRLRRWRRCMRAGVGGGVPSGKCHPHVDRTARRRSLSSQFAGQAAPSTGQRSRCREARRSRSRLPPKRPLRERVEKLIVSTERSLHPTLAPVHHAKENYKPPLKMFFGDWNLNLGDLLATNGVLKCQYCPINNPTTLF